MKKSKFILAAIFGFGLASCNNAADKDKKTEESTTANATTTAPVGTPFTKEVTYEKYKFVITTAGEGDQHHFKIIPSGLEFNDTLHEDVKGTISDVIIDDIDGDNSPEIGVIDISGANKQGHLHVFTTFNGKSMGYTHFPELPNDDKALAGYNGGDEYQFVENTLVRRFPIYEGETKTGKMRQLQYKLKPGEAMKQVVLDKTIEY